jgi:hypothetical protein
VPTPTPAPTQPNSISGDLARIYNQVGEYQGSIAFPYFKNGWYLHVENSSGAHNYLIPNYPMISQQYSKVVMTSPTEVWIAYGIPLVANRYQIVNGSLVQISSTTVGNTNSRLLDFIQLASGKLLIAYYQYENLSAGGVNIGFAYRNSLGNWVSMPYTFLSPCTVASNGSLTQHPADGSIWFFQVADGSATIRAIHLVERGDSLAVDWVDNAFIPYVYGNTMTPEGEFPWIASVADPSSNSIIIAYQNFTYKYFGSPIQVKGANIAVVKVNADGTKSLMFVLDKWVERIEHFALGVVNGQVWLAYGEVDPANLNWNSLSVTTNNNTQTQYLGTLDGANLSSGAMYLCNTTNWVIGEMNDGSIHFYGP